MKWLATAITASVASALEQFSWGLLEAYGYDPQAAESAVDDTDSDQRTPKEREADIALFASTGHF